MKILLLGKNGQLGWELQRALSCLGKVIALDRKGEKNLCGDLTNIEGLAQTIRIIAPDIVVNAAAYTAVDQAENEKELATIVNSSAPEVLAREVAALGGWLVHYSTDYVFDGGGLLFWKESDLVNPINFYGETKLAGEQAIQASGCKHFIFRTSWLYGIHGNNFIKTILRLAREREVLNIVVDQIGAPTGVDLLADVTAHSLRTIPFQSQIGGLYHVAADGETSWYDYTNFIINAAQDLKEKILVKTIKPIQSSDYKSAAKRPLNSRLATTKLTKTFSLNMPHWKVGIIRILPEILGNAT